jgi:hypothetical protein
MGVLLDKLSDCTDASVQNDASVLVNAGKGFDHVTSGRFTNVYAIHLDPNKVSFSQDNIDTILLSKYLFLDAIDSRIRNNTPLPKYIDRGKLIEAYSRADFDWADKKTFLEFFDWYMKNLSNPLLGYRNN